LGTNGWMGKLGFFELDHLRLLITGDPIANA
jgi:hypothetical protein